jgi:hypothetical protein
LARKPAHARSACSRAAQTARVDTVHSGPSASRARALASSQGVADSGPPLSASSSSSGRPNRRRDRAICAPSASCDSLVVFSTPRRISGHPLHPLSPSLAPATTDTADGRLGRADAGHYERVERDLSSAKASGAHHDFNRARSGGGGALVDAGHGDVLAAALGRS